jgi:ATPase subunit of ABC transporter with duplicated ATPase domains
MSLVRVQNIEKHYEATCVLREVYFTLSAGERVGLIGRNGAGKTTLLRLILGQEQPDAGAVEVEMGARIGYFSQFSELNGDATVYEILDGLFADIHALEYELAELEDAFTLGAEGRELARLLDRQARLLAELEQRDGWNVGVRIDTVLSKLGFSPEDRRKPIRELSGGWRNRAALAKILLEEPDILLMDEPTNYLDVDGLAWLESWFQKFRGALLLVSHDRHFLDTVVTRIVEIENFHLQEYQGGYSLYVRERQLRLKTLERQYLHEEELLVFEAESIADRREAAKNPTRALQRRLANIKQNSEPKPVDRIVTGLYAQLHASADLARVEELGKAYPGRTLFDGLSFEIHRGDRIAILGANGCGKTTLLRVLTGGEEADAGKIAWVGNAAYIYYNQVFESLDLNDTVSHAVNVVDLAFLAPRKKVNQFLSLMQFSELDLKKPIRMLSGGQRARVALAQCLLSGANVLLLDEPTNHLDLASTQVMERALIHFPGAVVVVSHDRFFIDKIATRLLVFAGQGKVEEFGGNWTLWQAKAVETAGREEAGLETHPPKKGQSR